MIEAKVNFHGGNKEVYVSQLNGGFDEIAKDLGTILDRIMEYKTGCTYKAD